MGVIGKVALATGFEIATRTVSLSLPFLPFLARRSNLHLLEHFV